MTCDMKTLLQDAKKLLLSGMLSGTVLDLTVARPPGVLMTVMRHRTASFQSV